MKSNIKNIILTLTFLFISSFSFAQLGSEVGIMVGGNYYNGDINPEKLFSDTKFAFGAFYKYNLDRRLAAKLGFNYGTLGASEKDYLVSPGRNAEFSSKIYDITLTGEFNFIQFYSGSKKHKFTPFIFGGIGYSIFSGNFSHNSHPLNNTDFTKGKYNGQSINIPFGIGFKYSLSDAFTITAEWGVRKLFTDKLDGLDEFYSNDPNDFLLYQVQLSNAKTNDWHSIAGITLAFDLSVFRGKECNTYRPIKKPMNPANITH